MNEDCIVTIITVTYNAESVIDKTLKSLKSQKFKNFEYLVIDGKSSDSTVKKVNEASIQNTTLLVEKDNGLYDAMNKGINLAKGKYILFLNAGDSFHSEDTLQDYINEANQDKDIIYGDTVIVNKNDEIISNRHLSAPSVLTKKSFSHGMLICHQAFMVKKEIAPYYNLSYKFSADYDWCQKCIENSNIEKCVNLNKVTIDYLDNGLTDNNKIKSLIERFRIMSKHYGFFLAFYRHFSFIFRALKRRSI